MKVIPIGSFPVSLAVYNHLSKNKHLDAVCFQEPDIENTSENFWVNAIQKEGFDAFLIPLSGMEKQSKA
ncbi:hypothetical protein [Flavivirga eckloniae]|uniref:Uncharacterized protein n=1 Tax=Flavivirga eckloniae TaxID=1803846 RepID=A0A2K9PQD1_9FLAO|nr:hypothetical protein [Flavivirga eckloniae]AUP79271.1 hypothetical protein C1H87_11375 [Flavivirga eckloniae]